MTLESYEKSPFKKWIKLIPFDESVSIDEYDKKDYFKLVADIVLDDEVIESGVNKGNKKRVSVIKFKPTISNTEFSKQNEWLYLFVINDKIVKIGGTRTSLKGRVGSYICGHYIKERNGSGSCSNTNGFIYNTFEFYLKLGYKVQMYGFEIPHTSFTVNIFDKEVQVAAQTYHAYESTCMGEFKNKYNKYPILSDNCDPTYRLS